MGIISEMQPHALSRRVGFLCVHVSLCLFFSRSILSASPEPPSTAPSTQPIKAGRDTPAGAMNVLVQALENGDLATIADSYYLPEDIDGSCRRAKAEDLLGYMEFYRAVAGRFGQEEANRMFHGDGIPPRKYVPEDFNIEPEGPHMA